MLFQVFCVGVWLVIIPLDDLKNLGAGGRADAGVIVEHPRNRADGIPRFFCNIFDGHTQKTPSGSRVPQPLALYSTGHHTINDILLADQIQNNDRQMVIMMQAIMGAISTLP